MKTPTIKTAKLLSILLFCSCSQVSQTAEVPEMAPAVAPTSQASKTEEQSPLPAAVLLQSKELFEDQETKSSEFAGDPLLGTQENFEQLDTDVSLQLEQSDFSQSINP